MLQALHLLRQLTCQLQETPMQHRLTRCALLSPAKPSGPASCSTELEAFLHLQQGWHGLRAGNG